MVETSTHNGKVEGSNPSTPKFFIQDKLPGEVIGNLSGSCPGYNGSNPFPAHFHDFGNSARVVDWDGFEIRCICFQIPWVRIPLIPFAGVA